MQDVTTEAAAAASTAAAVALPPAPDFSADRNLAAMEKELVAFSEAARVGRDACDQIAALAKLLLDQMEQPEFWRFPDRMAALIEVIWDRAAGAEAEITGNVEEIGCSFWTDASRRRQEAYSAARRG